MVKINCLLISTININDFFQNCKFFNHFIIGDFIFGRGNFDLACVRLCKGEWPQVDMSIRATTYLQDAALKASKFEPEVGQIRT